MDSNLIIYRCDLGNVAYGKYAVQTSVVYSLRKYGAGLAVDGTQGTGATHFSFPNTANWQYPSHYNLTIPASWTVDLGAFYGISRVIITNRVQSRNSRVSGTINDSHIHILSPQSFFQCKHSSS